MAPTPDPSAPFRRRHKFQVFDLVEDRVLSRLYTIIALVMLPIIMSRIFLLDAMPDAGEPANLVPHSLTVFHIPRSGVAIGRQMLVPMKVLLRDNTSAPIPDAKVSVSLGFSAICQQSLQNMVQTTDSDGIASFHDLLFNGVPGLYHLTFSIPAGKGAPIQMNASVVVVPAAVSIIPSNRPPTTVEIGTEFGETYSPKVTVLSSDGLVLAGRTVHAIAVGDMRDVGVHAQPVFVTGRPGIPHDLYAPHYETTGSWQAITSQSGIANFNGNMKVTAASSNSITFALYCDGVWTMWSEVLASTSLRYTTILDKIPRLPSLALPTDPVVVLDSYLMRALPSRSIGHLASASPPDERVLPLLEIVINTNGAGGSGIVTFLPGARIFETLNNVQVLVRQYGSSDNWVAGVKIFCRAVPRLSLNVEPIAQQYELATDTLDEEAAVEGQYMTKFKFLTGYLSSPSDNQGMVKFPLLAFSRHGLPGTYELQFYADSGSFAPLPFSVAVTHLFAYADYAPTDTISSVSFDPICIAAREEMAESRGQSNIPAGAECFVVQLGQPWLSRDEAIKVTTLTSDGSMVPGSSVNMEAIDLPAKIPFIDPISLVPSLVPPPRVAAFVPRDFQFGSRPSAVFKPFVPHKDGIASTTAVTYKSSPSTPQSPSLLFDVIVACIKPQPTPLAGNGSSAVYSIVHLNIMGGGTHGLLVTRPLVLAVRVDRFVSAELICAPATGMVPSGAYNPALPLLSQIDQISPQYCGDIIIEKPINDAQYVVAEKTLTNDQTVVARIQPAWMGNVSSLSKRRLCIGWIPLSRDHRAPVSSGVDATYDWYESSNPWTNPAARIRPFCGLSGPDGLVQFTSLKFLFPAIIEYFVFEALDIETYSSIYSLLPAAEQNTTQASIRQSYERCMSSFLGTTVRNGTGCVSRRYVANIGMPFTMIGTPTAGLKSTSTGIIPFPMGTEITSSLVNSDNNPFVMDAPWNSKILGINVLSAAHIARSPIPVVTEPSSNTIGRVAGIATSSITYDTTQITNRLFLGKGLLIKLQQSSIGLVQGISFALAGVRATTMFAIRTMSWAVITSCEQYISSSDFASASNYISIYMSNSSTRCTLPQIDKSALLYTNETLAGGGGAAGIWNSSATTNVAIGQSFLPQLRIQVLGCTGQPLTRQDFSIHARLQRLDTTNQWQEDAASEFLRDAVSQPQGGTAGIHAFPASFGLDYAGRGTYRLVFYIMETAMLRQRIGNETRAQFDVPPLYSASFLVAGSAAFSLNFNGGSVVSNAASGSVPDQTVSVHASLVAPRSWQHGNNDNVSHSEVWVPPRVRVSVTPMTHAMIHGAVPLQPAIIGQASVAQFSHSDVTAAAVSDVSALGSQWPGYDNIGDSVQHRVPPASSPAFAMFLSQIDRKSAMWSSAAEQATLLHLQPVCTLDGSIYSCASPSLHFPVSAHFQPSVPFMALAFIQGNPIPVAATPVVFADSPQIVVLLSAPPRLHQFVRVNIVCRISNRVGAPVSSAPVELLLQQSGDLKTSLAPLITEGKMLKQSDSHGRVSFAISVIRGQATPVTVVCRSQGIASEPSTPIPLLMEAKLSILQNVGSILSKVNKIAVPSGSLRCCSPPSSDGESVVPVVVTTDKSADRALMEQASLGLQNSGGRQFSFVVSDKVSDNIQMLFVDQTGQVFQSLVLIETAEIKIKGSCSLIGFQLNSRIESGFYRVAMCYNSQCVLPNDEIYVDNRSLDYSNISRFFFLIMLISAFASPFFFVPNLVDNSRYLFFIPVTTGIIVAFASRAYNIVSLQPLANTIYINFRVATDEENLLSSMLQLVCIILILLSLLQLFLSLLFPKSQFYAAKTSSMQSLFARIGAPDVIIKEQIAFEDKKASSIRTEGLFVVQVAPRSSIFQIPQVSTQTLIHHYWTMISAHIQKLFYRIYSRRPYRDSLYGRTSDFVFPQRVTSPVLILAVAIVAVSFLFYFIVRTFRFTIDYCRRIYTEAAVYSDLFLWELLPNSLPPYFLDPNRTPLSIMIIYDFISNTAERGTVFYLELLSSFAISIAVSVILSSIVIALVAVQSLSVYRKEILQARRGRLDWGPYRGLSGGTHVENAVRYVGTQTVAYVIGWLFVLILLFVPIFAIAWSPVRRFLTANLQILTILSVLIVIAGALLSRLFRYLTLDENQNIRNRKAFSYLEVFSLPLHYAFGLFSSLWRMLMAMFTFISSIAPLSYPLFIYSDPAYASYRAGQYIDHLHNSPAPFSLATTMIRELDRRYIRLNTPTTAEPSLIQLEIGMMEQAEARRKLIAAWQHLCVFANNDTEFSLHARRYESKYAVGIRVNSASSLLFGANAKAQKGGSSVNMATYVPPKFSSRASILEHNFAIRQDRIKARAAAAITQAIAKATNSDSKGDKSDDEEPKMFLPQALRVAEFQGKLQKELQPKAFATLPSNELKDMVGGQAVLAFEKDLKKLSIRDQLGESLRDDEDAEEATESQSAAGAAAALPPGLIQMMGLSAPAVAGDPVKRITQTYRMAQNEMHRREVAKNIELGADNIQARVQVRNDLLLSKQTIDSLAKETRK